MFPHFIIIKVNQKFLHFKNVQLLLDDHFNHVKTLNTTGITAEFLHERSITFVEPVLSHSIFALSLITVQLSLNHTVCDT